jgi:hypothetical protein
VIKDNGSSARVERNSGFDLGPVAERHGAVAYDDHTAGRGAAAPPDYAGRNAAVARHRRCVGPDPISVPGNEVPRAFEHDAAECEFRSGSRVMARIADPELGGEFSIGRYDPSRRCATDGDPGGFVRQVDGLEVRYGATGQKNDGAVTGDLVQRYARRRTLFVETE